VLQDSDEILLVVDVSEPPNEEDQLLFSLLHSLRRSAPLLIALNKRDAVDDERFELHRRAFQEALPQAQALAVSALHGAGLDALRDALLEHLPEGEPFFPEDQTTDLYERELAADLIREAALNLLRDEVPHGVAIRIDTFTERGEEGAYIEATLFVERESHKGIVIGQGGVMLKKIGSLARQEIERMSGRKVFLQIKVKVRKNWRDDEKTIQAFGFNR
jgi:GTP-binding protein Era